MSGRETIYPISGGYANSYLIEGEGGLVAIDVGSSLAAEKIVNFITVKLNRKIDELRLITATHFHIDHIGGISRLLKLAPNAQVNFFSRVGNYLTGEEKLDIPPFLSWIRGLIPAVYRMPRHFRNSYQFCTCMRAGIPFPILRNFNFLDYKPKCELKENQGIPFLSNWILIETRGHTPDSISFYRETDHVLISGDTILNLKGNGELNGFCCSRKDIRDSFLKLSQLTVESIYPGHGKPIVGVNQALSRVKT